MEIGIDIVYIPRLEGKDALAKRLLSNEEYNMYRNHYQKAQFFAGRLACREAYVKAKKGRVDFHEFHNMKVLYDENHAPYLEYQGRRYQVSIAHDGDYAIAVLVME